MKIKLVPVTTTHPTSPLRTTEVVGEPSPWPPVLGQSLKVVGEPLDPEADIRVLKTSPVQAIVKIDASEIGLSGERNHRLWRIRTENSVYELSVLEEEDDLEEEVA